MTKEEIETRKESLKVTLSISDILSRYGVEVKRGRCRSICHEGNNYTAKVSKKFYYCFKCSQSMDIFDITMHFNHCDFWTAFELLGGTENISYTAVRKAKSAIREREDKKDIEVNEKLKLRQINLYITAYRNIISENEPFSDLWCYAQNKLQYQIYSHELQDEKR